MAQHIEDLSQFLQSFGVGPLALLLLLLLPVLITALARNGSLVLATILLSFASSMPFVAPASATTTGLAIVCGLGSFLVALESIVARRRTMALNKEIADLTNQLERADQRRQILEIKASGHHATKTDPRLHKLLSQLRVRDDQEKEEPFELPPLHTLRQN
jgi:hypothetical protein